MFVSAPRSRKRRKRAGGFNKPEHFKASVAVFLSTASGRSVIGVVLPDKSSGPNPRAATGFLIRRLIRLPRTKRNLSRVAPDEHGGGHHHRQYRIRSGRTPVSRPWWPEKFGRRLSQMRAKVRRPMMNSTPIPCSGLAGDRRSTRRWATAICRWRQSRRRCARDAWWMPAAGGMGACPRPRLPYRRGAISHAKGTEGGLWWPSRGKARD